MKEDGGSYLSLIRPIAALSRALGTLGSRNAVIEPPSGEKKTRRTELQLLDGSRFSVFLFSIIGLKTNIHYTLHYLSSSYSWSQQCTFLNNYYLREFNIQHTDIINISFCDLTGCCCGLDHWTRPSPSAFQLHQLLQSPTLGQQSGKLRSSVTLTLGLHCSLSLKQIPWMNDQWNRISVLYICIELLVDVKSYIVS